MIRSTESLFIIIIIIIIISKLPYDGFGGFQLTQLLKSLMVK